MTQLNFFIADIKRILGKKKIRILHIWMSRSFCGVFMYRLERSLYLLLENIILFLEFYFLHLFIYYRHIQILKFIIRLKLTEVY